MAAVLDTARSWAVATVEVGRELGRQWQQDRVNGLAAEVAFFLMLSAFPALLALAAAMGSLEVIIGADAADRARVAVLDALRDVLTDQADQLFDAVDELFLEGAAGILTVAMVGALWAMSRGFAAVIRSLNVAYNTTEARGWVKTRLLALVLALGSVIVIALVAAMLVVGPLLGGGRAVADSIGLGEVFAFLWDWLRAPVAFAIVVAWAATIYHAAPSHRSPWRWDLPGAFMAGVLWVAFSFGFRVYLEVAARGNEVLGVLGGALIMLLWLYVLSIALLLGGELNAVLSRRHGIRSEQVT